MKRIAKFEKVSFEEFMKAIEDIYPDWDENYIRRVYDDIVLPKRATSGSAGYDFLCLIVQHYFQMILSKFLQVFVAKWMMDGY